MRKYKITLLELFNSRKHIAYAIAINQETAEKNIQVIWGKDYRVLSWKTIEVENTKPLA